MIIDELLTSHRTEALAELQQFITCLVAGDKRLRIRLSRIKGNSSFHFPNACILYKLFPLSYAVDSYLPHPVISKVKFTKVPQCDPLPLNVFVGYSRMTENLAGLTFDWCLCCECKSVLPPLTSFWCGAATTGPSKKSGHFKHICAESESSWIIQ